VRGDARRVRTLRADVLTLAASAYQIVLAVHIAAAAEGEITLGDYHQALLRRRSIVGSGLGTLVLVTILFMVVKP